ncbi:hypothetical protein [Neobacillus sp. SuZ13]|uniref:hypothetical protein n=1 Tax=Neobacillus sp. SuZ13 TaxID=3047875 RepID=UPI0024BFD5EE|nr:hypothetical protein [Neobacillus sp. SuZ13]WHY64754.1 hypothetical protein QNH17_16680 [Neobacillus sp. SuZ13]
MEKHRKLIESIRLYGSVGLGILMAIQWLNIIVGLSIVIVLAFINQLFIKPKLKPNKSR